ncbi:DUF4232 domain-containing protein [Microbacterium luticocti]|uniref:DUF4232 domain-containing protein n=1 Tax=Microbacterium luticocti TaxID=451764 RepID=UPI000408393E|nr:DUF4232 domain-containing protein [Microbacterium luticocti]
MTRRLAAAAVLAALWLLCGLGPYLLQFAGGQAATLGRMIPSPMRGGFFGVPVGWAVTVHVIAVVLVAAAYTMLCGWLARDGRVSFASGWLAAVLTGFTVGGVLDAGEFVTTVARSGVRGALSLLGAASLAVFWGLVVGWIPALIVRGGATTSSPRVATVTASTVAVLAAIALPLSSQAADAAAQTALQQARAQQQAQADPSGALAPDPDATGEPVPQVAASADPAPAGACAVTDMTLMAPASDAATGHRVQPLQLVNVADHPCTLTGYPDVAFGDQNGHLLALTVRHGSSFMATDPGPSRITLAPGQTARAAIAWDANSMHGQLVARALWVAPWAGLNRSRWDVDLDIIPGTTLQVTAWQTGTPAAG